MIVTKVLVLILLVIILCIVSFLNKDTEKFDIPTPEQNIIKEIEKLNKIKHNQNIIKNKAVNKQNAQNEIVKISNAIDTKMDQLLQIRDLLQTLPTCREIDLLPNNSQKTILTDYQPAALDDECKTHTDKKECYFKGAKNEKYCVWDKAIAITDANGAKTKKRWNDANTTEPEKKNWDPEADGYRCQLRQLNPTCAHIKKQNGTGGYKYSPYLIPNAFNSV